MVVTPNWVASLAFLLWPIVTLVLYRSCSISRATVFTILGGYLLLPVGLSYKFELIPVFDKDTVPSMLAIVACTIVLRKPPRLAYGLGLPEILIATLALGRLITATQNNDVIVIGATTLPSVGLYDGISSVIALFFTLIPFFLGRQLLRTRAQTEFIFRTLVVAGLIYSLPILLEIRLSPQLHTWIYGYFPHSMFGQQIREDGFRPVVFLGHGLTVAIFVLSALIAATALWRTRTRVANFAAILPAGYLFTILLLCKTLSALLYATLLVPLVRFANPRIQLLAAVLLVSVALLYPMLRTLDFIPSHYLVGITASISQDRAGSLETRFEQEKALLDRAAERYWFGWGRFGRYRIYDKSGYDVTLPDGFWVITIGQYGVVGFIATFGLLAMPVFRAFRALKPPVPATDKVFLAALALIVAILVFNLLPNSTLGPWEWLLIGALLGRAEALQERSVRRPSVALSNARTIRAGQSSNPEPVRKTY